MEEDKEAIHKAILLVENSSEAKLTAQYAFVELKEKSLSRLLEQGS